ncbi:hypothetical protein AGMMS49587_02770 [Spirochaetia bacterium]|nr:hypothetical protein AGMMS49587_02770 [Spirochaetia bacterium]
MNIYQFILSIYDKWPLNLFFFFFFIIFCICIGIVYKQVVLDFIIQKLWTMTKGNGWEFAEQQTMEDIRKLFIERDQENE